MIDHLIYVLWEDHWKPKIKAFLEWVKYGMIGLAIITVLVFAAIFLEILMERIM